MESTFTKLHIRQEVSIGGFDQSGKDDMLRRLSRNAKLTLDFRRISHNQILLFIWLFFFVFLERRIHYAWVPSAPLFGLAFFAFELLSVSSFIGFLITLLHSRKSPGDPPVSPENIGIDVFIPTLNEDVALLRRPVRRAIAIRYPHQTWLLDDGNRPEVKALAEELEYRYLVRKDRGQGGKAGNLNAAIKATEAPFVLVLDADAIAHESILERTLGYFLDPQLAFVQTPQVFSNVDAFELNYDPMKGTLWSAADLFHFDLQRGFAQLNAALCVGSGFVFRRSAVLAVGGFKTGLAAEDIQLSLDLHRTGWRSYYVDEVLALHLAPDGLGQYWTQQVRWARGTQHLLKRLFSVEQLSSAQWLAYGQMSSGYLLELLRVLFRFVPAFGAVANVSFLGPGFQDDAVFLVVYLSWLVIAYTAPMLLSNGRMRPTVSKAFTLLRAGPAFVAFWQDLMGNRVRFAVTPKGAGAQAPLAAYVFPVAGVVFGGIAAFIAIEQLLVNSNYWLLVVTFFNLEFLVLGLLALWIVRDRRISQDADTIIAHRKGMMLINGDNAHKVPLKIIRLGAARAIAVGPLGLHGKSGILKVELGNEEYRLQGLLRKIPNCILPRIKTQQVSYELIFALTRYEHDRLADQIDCLELWRFFGSLKNYHYKLPPTADHFDSKMVYYPLRPRAPSFRF